MIVTASIRVFVNLATALCNRLLYSATDVEAKLLHERAQKERGSEAEASGVKRVALVT